MSMPDKASMRKNRVGAQRLPVDEKRKKALGIFLLLQIYFTSNILSFGFWKSSPIFFGYQTVFYGTWLVGLVLVLFLFLRISSRFGLVRFDPVILLIFSLPFCFGLWLQTLAVLPDKLLVERHLDYSPLVRLLPFRCFVYRHNIICHD